MVRDTIRTGSGEVGWESILKDNLLAGGGHEGDWKVSGSTLYVDALKEEGAWLGISDEVDDFFEFTARMAAPTMGGNASIFFRQHDGGQKALGTSSQLASSI